MGFNFYYSELFVTFMMNERENTELSACTSK
jgi:hypothetical protein